MDNGRFDDLTRLLGAGVSRRGMIKGIVATLIGSGTVVAGRALPVSAQCAGDVCTSTLDCCPGHLCIGNECVECLDFGEGCSISGTPCCDPTLECGFDYDQRINVCRVPCVDDGQDCSSGLECCQNDNYCTSFNLCQSCIEEGNQFCQEDTDCCTGLVCASGTCSTPCVGGRSCTTDGDCCAEGETCVSGTCAVACRELGFSCATADQCCSQACSEGSCCSGLGGACPGGSGCCGTASCENDVCCSAEGRACGGNQDCCSGLDCDDSNTCVPPCVPVGEGCSQTSECCNLAGSLAVQCLGAICTVCIPTGDSSTVCPTDDDDDEAVAVGCCDPNAIYDEAICSCVLRTCIERGEECGQLDCCDSEVPYLTGFCDPGNVCEFCRPTGVAPVVCEPVTGQLEPCCDRNAVYNETVCACEVVTCTPIGSACAEDDDDDCCGELSECENGACCNNQGGACNDDPECCFRRYCDDQSQTCVFCSSPGGACDRDAVCCSGSCVDDVCVCRLDGTCRSDADCCVGSYCSGGQCVQCLPDGEGIYCATDQACCSGNCDNSNCGCRSLQTNCESAEQCCSGYCIDGRCAEEAGCAPLGEACQEPEDCCGVLAMRASPTRARKGSAKPASRQRIIRLESVLPQKSRACLVAIRKRNGTRALVAAKSRFVSKQATSARIMRIAVARISASTAGASSPRNAPAIMRCAMPTHRAARVMRALMADALAGSIRNPSTLKNRTRPVIQQAESTHCRTRELATLLRSRRGSRRPWLAARRLRRPPG